MLLTSRLYDLYPEKISASNLMSVKTQKALNMSFDSNKVFMEKYLLMVGAHKLILSIT